MFLPPPNDDVLVSLIATHTGTCLMAHLGLTTVTKVESVFFDAGGVHVVGDGVTFTAASGDRLRASESAELSLLDADGRFTFTGAWTFTGGTGRFSGASGKVDFTGSGSVVTSTTERSFEGRISY